MRPLSGVHVMARAMDALARANVEVLAISGIQLPPELLLPGARRRTGATVEALEAGLALELAHGYVSPIDIDREVGLLAVVGEGMRGRKVWRAASSRRSRAKTSTSSPSRKAPAN